MTITAITCACNRPEAWKLAESYVARQTVKPDQWLVLDDDDPKTICTMGQDYYHWPEMTGRGSLAKKLKRALDENLIKGDAVVIIENDDYYAPDYIEWCVAELAKTPLIGEGRAIYYNVNQRFWFSHVNLRHASLCSTAFTREVFPWLLKQCTVSNEPFVDERFWRNPPVASVVEDPDKVRPWFRRVVGIKAMPGRVGYGGGHKGRDKAAVDDLDLSKLRSLIGDDADAYAPFYDPTAVPPPPEHNAHIAVPNPNVSKLIARSECGRVHGPNWFKWLGHLRGKENAVGMELGTFEGDSAEWMMENVFNNPRSRYHCCDPFTGSIEHKLGRIDVTRLEQTTRTKLARFSNVEIHKGYSQQVMRGMKVGTFDAIYIDAGHSARDVLRDAVLAFDLLKVGGVAIFDDYKWAVMPNEIDRPKTGIDAFLKCYSKQLEILEPRGWQISVRKRSED